MSDFEVDYNRVSVSWPSDSEVRDTSVCPELTVNRLYGNREFNVFPEI
jgi:hypothetical protein